MARGQKLRTKIHKLEKRLSDLEKEFGGLLQKSLVLGAVLELMVDRGLIFRRELSQSINQTPEPYQEQIGQYVEEELRKLLESLLDEKMESLDEKEMPHA